MTSPPAQFSRRLLRWFDRHGRKSLPWRRRDPFEIWISEIMLQQTRVSTVIPYYRRFLARFPDIATLARSAEDDVLHHWSGLGYYARARNLHAAAKRIVAHHAGRFPDRFDQVLALPGIGRSTAGAILAFAWGRRYPILDGNVVRVLTRYYAIADDPAERKVKAQLWEIADRLTPVRRVGDYTQALMDLGATVCRRAKPLCADCPLAADCRAFRQGRGDPAAFPRRKPKAARPRRAVVMLVIGNHHSHHSRWLLVKRPPSGIWGGLWSLPEYAGAPPPGEQLQKRAVAQWCRQEFGLAVEVGEPLPIVRHSFTHFDLDILPLPAVCARTGEWDEGGEGGGRIMDSAAHLWYNPTSPAPVGLPVVVNRILGMFDES